VLGSPALRLIVKRLLTAIPILLGVSILMFVLLNLLPGSAALQLLGPQATPEQIAKLNDELGFNRPPVQRYLEWLGNFVRGDLGKSIVSKQPVAQVLPEKLAVTGELVALAFVISLGVAIPLALWAARRPNKIFDRISGLFTTAGLSLANYVLALLLGLAFAVKLPWFPSFGFTSISKGLGNNLYSLFLPAVALAFPLLCFYARFLRSDLVDQLQGEDYVMTARAKGLGPWRVLLRHAFRNSSFGLITIVGLNISTLIGATVIIERIFALPGIGAYLLDGILTRDYTRVQAIVMIFALITVLANLAADVLYAVLDPRIRYGSN
jgi:peptide/nickel transport system permease protein